MKHPFSQDKHYIDQLESIAQQIDRNQLQEVAQRLNQLVKTAPHDPRLFLLGSRLAESARNPVGALQAARKAHQLAPQWPVASIHLAAMLANSNEAEEAMAIAELAVQQAAGQTLNEFELLTKATSIAQRLGRHGEALQWLYRAEKISPGDLAIRHQIARTLSDVGDHSSAIALFTDLLQKQPKNLAVLIDRLRVCLVAQERQQAIRDAEALLGGDPSNETYRFYLDIARGLTPKTQPAALISGLFDGIALRYDHLWVTQLLYKLPRDVAQMIHRWHPDLKGDILDLGCGTGLLGACLGPNEGVLVGVDLSENMIEQAARHRVYDSFHHVNLLDALQATPASLYHVITALDVFGYVGNLDDVVTNAYRILLPGGYFVFSCEESVDAEADYALPGTYRYTHQRSYVQRLLDEAGFKEIEIEDRILRYDAGRPVNGVLVTARKKEDEKKRSRKRVLKST